MDPTLLLGLVGALGALLSGAGALGGYRLARRQHDRQIAREDERRRPELDQLIAETTGAITAAANSAVASMTAALKQAEHELREVRSELAAARADLRVALADRDGLHSELAAARATITALEARVAELESLVGGRRDSDAPGPALSS